MWPGGLPPGLLLATVAGEVCEQTAGRADICTGFSLPVWLGIPALIVSVAAPLIVAVVLLSRATRRRATADLVSPR